MMGRTRFCIRDPYLSACVPKQVAKLTTARAGPEVGTGELDNGAGVRVDESLAPHDLEIVPGLHNVCEATEPPCFATNSSLVGCWCTSPRARFQPWRSRRAAAGMEKVAEGALAIRLKRGSAG